MSKNKTFVFLAERVIYLEPVPVLPEQSIKHVYNEEGKLIQVLLVDQEDKTIKEIPFRSEI